MHCRLTEPEVLQPGDMFLFEFKWSLLLKRSESHCSLDDTVTLKIYNQSCIDSNLYVFVIYPLSRAKRYDALHAWLTGRMTSGHDEAELIFCRLSIICQCVLHNY